MFIEDYISESVKIKEKLLADKNALSNLNDASELIVNAFKSGNKVLLVGNGGSAADAQHIAAEFVGKLNKDRNPLPAIALTTDTSVLTSIGNDYGYTDVFSRQIRALGVENDILIALSTSGKSKNILSGLEMAKSCGLTMIGFSGEHNSSMDQLCDIVLKVPSSDTQQIQETHMMFGHIICSLVENKLEKELI